MSIFKRKKKLTDRQKLLRELSDKVCDFLQPLRKQYGIRLISAVLVDTAFSFPKNTTNCFCYGRCIYADLCKMVANPDTVVNPPEGFVVDKWDPRNH